MARSIEEITTFTALEDTVVKNAGVEGLPNSPSSAGIRASELKKRFYQPLEEVRDDIDDRFTKINSNFEEIDTDLTTLEGLAFDKANIEQEVTTSTTKVPSSNVLKTQLDLKVSKAGAEDITGIKTYKTGATPLIEDAPSSNTMAANKAYVDTKIPLTSIKTAISETPLDTNLLSEKFINTTYATKAEIASVFEYKGTVADYTALSAITGQGVGDTYNMTASYNNTPAGTNWAWNGSAWDALGGDIIIETSQSTSAVKVPSSNLLTQSSFARVYRTLAELGLSGEAITPEQVFDAMASPSIFTIQLGYTGNTALLPNYGWVQSGNLTFIKAGVNGAYATFNVKYPNGTYGKSYIGHYRISDSSNKFTGWIEVIDSATAQTISAIKTYSVSPLVPTTPSGVSAAVAKSYADLKVALAGEETIIGKKTFATGATPLITDQPTTDLMAVNKAYCDSRLPVYDKVIRTQAEFDALIASATWLDAVSVAIVGQFTLSTTDNSGVKIPATVKQIHGFNSAKITITNFKYNASTAKGGLWYDTAPTTQDYSIRDLEVSCTGTPYSSCFYNCNNLSNCTGTGTGGEYGRGFYNCNNLSNCTGTGTGTTNGSGFSSCNNLSNCTGTGTGTTNGYGFSYCDYLSNCTGKGVDSTDASDGFGFSDIDYAVNCKDGGSSTNMWDGTNTNIDLDTCVKTLVTASNTTLNT